MPSITISIPVPTPTFRSLFIGDKNPDYVFDSDEELIALARELGATHIRLPYGVLGGSLLQRRELGFFIIARWGHLKDGRIFANNYYGGVHYGLDEYNFLTEIT